MISSIAADVVREGDRSGMIIGYLAPQLWGQSGENEREELGPDLIGIVICWESASKCQVADNKIEWPGPRDRRREERCYKKVVELSLASFLSLARALSPTFSTVHCIFITSNEKTQKFWALSIKYTFREEDEGG